jgi:hypothetical protein
MPGENCGRQQGCENFAGYPGDLVPIGDFAEDNDEFVTAEPRHHVAIAHATAKPFGDLDQQGVTGRVPKRVVDHLEPVEIDE